MIFLFPDSRLIKYRQGHTLYDRLPRPRSLWKRAEELTGEKVIGFSFGTPTEAMKPGPLARLGAFLHAVSAAEALAKSGKTPSEACGLGEGLVAAAAWAGAISMDQGMLAAFTGTFPANSIFEAPKVSLRGRLASEEFLTEAPKIQAELEACLKAEPALDGPEIVGLLAAWKRGKAQSVVIPGPGASLAAALRKLEPGLQALPASELEDIGTILKVVR